jgi:Ca2+-transporting ATPase
VAIHPHKAKSLLSEAPWSREAEQVLAELQVDASRGLDTREVQSRLSRFGKNQLADKKTRSALGIMADQFKSIVVLVLVAVGVLAVILEDQIEGFAIFAVVLINALIGFLTEWRATRSMEALHRLGRVETVVIRDGQMTRLPSEELVPGDIVALEGGDIVSADLRLLEASRLQADESALTGESLPVSKSLEALPRDARLMDRHNMLFKGTALARGSCKAVVVGTAFDTELGHIASLASSAEAQITPLEKRLNSLATRLVWIVLLLAAVVAGAGLVSGRDTWLAIEIAIVLAVSAIPEGLPIVATIALARGMWRMANHNALIARLSAVETLGATRVILTDKTGTLTENRMSVTQVRCSGSQFALPEEDNSEVDPGLVELLETAVLCSNASLTVSESGAEEAIGDATEIALLRAAVEQGIEQSSLASRLPEVKEYAFDPHSKRMATVHSLETGYLIAAKGAPETLLPVCGMERAESGDRPLTTARREYWLQQVEELGAAGLRTLAIARREAPSEDSAAFENLTLLGIVGLEDPPRAGVREAIAHCHDAGIDVVMVTGDHAATARHIATQVGIITESANDTILVTGEQLEHEYRDRDQAALLQARVFSRVTPEQKLGLIKLYQDNNEVVAMTGDGVNDAPALKKADIGVAMGIRGTDVAKEAADMVLRDDEFNTIVLAIAYGRAIFENIRKFVVYLLSCNISEIIAVSLASLAGAPLPLLPLQILFLNLVTDVFPALALGVGEGSDSLMKEKPRAASESILTPAHWQRIVIHGTVIALTTLGAMAVSMQVLDFELSRAVTVSFCTLALAQLWHVFNMRSSMSKPFDNEIVRNPWIWAAVVICIALILVAIYVPFLADVLELEHPGMDGWLVIILMSPIPLMTAPLVRMASRWKKTDPVLSVDNS